MARGGKREGAGRPKGVKNKVQANPRKQWQLRAYEDEIELIKAFVAIVRKDKEKAKHILEEV